MQLLLQGSLSDTFLELSHLLEYLHVELQIGVSSYTALGIHSSQEFDIILHFLPVLFHDFFYLMVAVGTHVLK